mgnify:CR=1 FL=1
MDGRGRHSQKKNTNCHSLKSLITDNLFRFLVPHARRGLFPVMAYTGRLHLKGVRFSRFRYMKEWGFREPPCISFFSTPNPGPTCRHWLTAFPNSQWLFRRVGKQPDFRWSPCFSRDVPMLPISFPGFLRGREGKDRPLQPGCIGACFVVTVGSVDRWWQQRPIIGDKNLM